MTHGNMFDLQGAVKAGLEQADKEPVSGNPRPLTDAQRTYNLGEQRTQLDSAEAQAEGYALMGEFERAIELATGKHRDEYQKRLDSLDKAPCGCSKVIGQGKSRVETSFVRERFIRRGEEKALWTCVICREYWSC